MEDDPAGRRRWPWRRIAPFLPLGGLALLFLAGRARRALDAFDLFARPDAAVLRYFVLPVLLIAIVPVCALLAAPGADPRPAAPPDERLARRWRRAIIACALAYGAGQAILHGLRIASFHATYWDLGVFDHTLWRMAHRGEWRLALAGHVSPILWLYALAYVVIPSATFLMALQAFGLAIGALPLFRLASRRIGPRLGGIVALVYLLVPALPCIESTGFHPDHLIVPIGLLLADAADRRAPRTLLAAALAGLLIKEVFILPVGLAVFVALLRWRRPLAATAALAASVAIFAAATSLLPTMLAPAAPIGEAPGPYAHLGANGAEILSRIVEHPLEIAGMLAEKRRILYVLLVFLPFLFLPLRRPLELLPALPVLAASLLSSYRLYYTYQLHYTAGLLPFLLWAFVEALARVPERTRSLRPRRAIAVACLAATAIFHVFYAPTPAGLGFWLRGYDERFHREHTIAGPEVREIREAIARWIPPARGAVATQDGIIAGRIAHRARIACLNETSLDAAISNATISDGIDSFDFAIASPVRPYFNAEPTQPEFQGRARGVPEIGALWERIREARRTGARRADPAPIRLSEEHYVDLVLRLYDRWEVLEEGAVVIFRNPRSPSR
ncbi:MAG: DUF2079 domain-containing protein [Planctomycetes bacterium]|nr:DUF2079 domain-containing protein [Planctomycetota bacterium]